jgi:signal transduction histidine kinase
MMNLFKGWKISLGLHVKKNGQNLVIKIGQKAHGKGVIVDRVRFDQVTMNLLSNAIKYTPAGGTITYTSTSKTLT